MTLPPKATQTASKTHYENLIASRATVPVELILKWFSRGISARTRTLAGPPFCYGSLARTAPEGFIIIIIIMDMGAVSLVVML